MLGLLTRNRGLRTGHDRVPPPALLAPRFARPAADGETKLLGADAMQGERPDSDSIIAMLLAEAHTSETSYELWAFVATSERLTLTPSGWT